MNTHKEGWYMEICDSWPGIATSIEVNKVLHNEKSDYQDVMVLETKEYGKALVLDGIIQCTERDEFSYEESIAFLPLCCHRNPENVLIIGGGDEGVANEVAKCRSVKNITQIEIDSCVVKVKRKHFLSTSHDVSHSKVNFLVGDGFEYIKNHTNEFDVIITDSSDPVGPSEKFFGDSYYKMVSSALRPGGIVCSQAGTMWVQLDHVKRTLEYCRSAFPVASYCTVTVSTYTTGQIGFVIGSLDPNANLKEPLRTFTEKELDDMKLRYYTTEMHRAAFVLPRFIAKALRSTENTHTRL